MLNAATEALLESLITEQSTQFNTTQNQIVEIIWQKLL
jgi:hypothetical protein